MIVVPTYRLGRCEGGRDGFIFLYVCLPVYQSYSFIFCGFTFFCWVLSQRLFFYSFFILPRSKKCCAWSLCEAGSVLPTGALQHLNAWVTGIHSCAQNVSKQWPEQNDNVYKRSAVLMDPWGSDWIISRNNVPSVPSGALFCKWGTFPFHYMHSMHFSSYMQRE